MRKTILLTSLICMLNLLTSISIHAQGLESNDVENQLYQETDEIVTGQKSYIPPAVDLQAYCPTPKHQGQTPSCVGYACSYAQTIQHALKNGWTDKDAINASFFSPLYLYNRNHNRNAPACRGFSSLYKTLDFLTTGGNLRYNEFDTQYIPACNHPIEEELAIKGLDNKIESYRTIFGDGTRPDIKLKNMKESLSDSLVVIVGLDNFKFRKESTGMGKHAVTIVAYDDYKEEFTYINSYGKKWGKGGFGTISYDKFLNDVLYAYQIKIKDDGKVFIGSFRFVYELPNSINMKQASVEFRRNKYILRKAREYYKTGWQVGQGFQLMARNNLDSEYLYVFSITENDQTAIHYPMENAAPYSPLDQEIAIPSKNKVLVLEEAGKEHICILFCKEPMVNFEAVVNDIAGMDGDLLHRLEQYFGEYLISQNNIQYKPESMSFKAKQTVGETAFIVPVILEIEANE